MNWPNAITLCRIIAVPVVVLLLAYDRRTAAFLVFALASLSDALDGFLARVLNQRTELGSFLDPMADKLMAATVFVAAAVVGLVPVWLTIVVISRDVIVILGSLATHLVTGRLTIAPSPAGKVTTFLQFLTLAAVLAAPLLDVGPTTRAWLFTLTAILTVISGLHYVYMGLKLAGLEQAG